MLQAFVNIFRIPELRNRVLFTLGMLIVYRLGYWIPVPGVDQEALADLISPQGSEGSAIQRLATFVSMFSGGSLQQSTIFGLGIMPYITASIIFQLLASAYEPLKKKQQEGPTGRQQVMEWTRYATIGLCVIQGAGLLVYFNNKGIIYSNWSGNPLWWIMGVMALMAGTVFLMWLGEQIDKYGIGNGVSLIITAGIIAQMPNAIRSVLRDSPLGDFKFVADFLGTTTTGENTITWLGLALLLAAFFFVVAGVVVMTVAQRRIPIQQGKHTRGRKVYGGQRSFLPLRVNHSGVMPIIFASSLMIFPSVGFGMMRDATRGSTGWLNGIASFLADSFMMGEYLYEVCYVLMIFFFAYFWTTVQFNPEEMAKQLREHGSFIPGLRPGPRTAEYLEMVMERITYVGAGFLSIVAVVPTVIHKSMGIDFTVAAFLGGTGLLITVSVFLDLMQRIEANLLMRNYAGFLGDESGKGPKLRGPRSN